MGGQITTRGSHPAPDVFCAAHDSFLKLYSKRPLNGTAFYVFILRASEAAKQRIVFGPVHLCVAGRTKLKNY